MANFQNWFKDVQNKKLTNTIDSKNIQNRKWANTVDLKKSQIENEQI